MLDIKATQESFQNGAFFQLVLQNFRSEIPCYDGIIAKITVELGDFKECSERNVFDWLCSSMATGSISNPSRYVWDEFPCHRYQTVGSWRK